MLISKNSATRVLSQEASSAKPQIQIQLNKVFLNNALPHHCVSYFHKSGNISTLHIIDISVGFCAVFHALGMDAVHDRMKLFIYFGSAPSGALRFETFLGRKWQHRRH